MARTTVLFGLEINLAGDLQPTCFSVAIMASNAFGYGQGCLLALSVTGAAYFQSTAISCKLCVDSNVQCLPHYTGQEQSGFSLRSCAQI
eukprot:6187333-Pleurochrysis_carterae.AAC.1